MLPDELQECKMYGTEIDSISGRLAKQLYQKSNIEIRNYQDMEISDNFYDIAIGNVPFGEDKTYDKRYAKNNFVLHDYFFAKTIDKVRSGGVIAFITSKGTLDKENPSFRKYIAQRAELIGAIRLPDDTFQKNAGTRVTSDIIFLQKRDKVIDIVPDWVYIEKNKDNIPMNKYFIDNPNMILGNMKLEPSQYGMKANCKPFENVNFEQLLSNAIANIKAEIKEYDNDIGENQNTDKTLIADPNVKNFSYTIVNNEVYFRENSKMYFQDLPVEAINRIKGLIALRDCVRNLIQLQTENYSDEEIQKERQRLNSLYDNFKRKYGLITDKLNNKTFSEDSSYFLLCSLEVLDSDGKFIRKADIFSKRTIKPAIKVTKVDTANEALILSLSEKACVDLEYMSELTEKTQEEIIKDLKGSIFKVPIENRYVTAEEYLSGNVREKLELNLD